MHQLFLQTNKQHHRISGKKKKANKQESGGQRKIHITATSLNTIFHDKKMTQMKGRDTLYPKEV